MGRSKNMKRSRRQFDSHVKSLPSDLVTEVLALVASSSLTALFNAKLTCKEFYKYGDDIRVFQRASIANLPAVPWWISSQTSTFLKRCEESGNPEALYKLGMVEYFSFMRLESGRKFLKKAANLGHMEALYVLGIILLCSGGDDESSLKGLELLKKLDNSQSRIQECRERTKMILRQMWINTFLRRRRRESTSTNSACSTRGRSCHLRRGGWPSGDDKDNEEHFCCEACKWDHEITLFCNILYGFS